MVKTDTSFSSSIRFVLVHRQHQPNVRFCIQFKWHHWPAISILQYNTGRSAPSCHSVYLISMREPDSQQTAPWVQMPAWCQQRQSRTVHIRVCKPPFSVHAAKLQLLPKLHLQQGDTITLTKQLRATFQHCLFTKYRINNFLEKAKKIEALH